MEAEPKLYPAIMVSSTFTDLEAHRREVIDAIHRFGFRANAMEYSGARSDADVIDTSLRMVRDSAAYLCVIGHKYGQTPVDADRNPKGLSITELEFNEARRLGRPILLFLMGDDHPVTRADIEPDARKSEKLQAFREQAKRIDPGAMAERVYETFASKDELAKKAAIAVGREAIRLAGRSGVPDRVIRSTIARFIDVQPDVGGGGGTREIRGSETDNSNWDELLLWLDSVRKKESKRPSDAVSAPSNPVPLTSDLKPLESGVGHDMPDRVPLAPLASALLLGLLAILFVLVVGNGWYLLIAPAAGKVPALVMALLITAVGLLVARTIGRTVASTHVGPGHRRPPLVLYPLLFSISSLAVFNTAFYLFEGPVILRETIDESETRLLALAGAATVALRARNAEGTAAAVERLLTELDTEITNPSNCGAGPGTSIIVGQIRTMLPDFRELGIHRRQDCSLTALRRASQLYREQAYGLLNLDPEERRLAALRTQITGPVANAHMRLHTVRLGLANARFPASYQPALRAVTDAADVYADGYDRLAAAKPAFAKSLTPRIDVSQARNLGSISSFAGLLAARVSRLSTWVYFIVALSLDLLLVFQFSEHERRVQLQSPGRTSLFQRIVRFSTGESFYQGVVLGIVITMIFFLALVGLWTLGSS